MSEEKKRLLLKQNKQAREDNSPECKQLKGMLQEIWASDSTNTRKLALQQKNHQYNRELSHVKKNNVIPFERYN